MQLYTTIQQSNFSEVLNSISDWIFLYSQAKSIPNISSFPPLSLTVYEVFFCALFQAKHPYRERNTMKTVTGIYTSAIIYHTNNPKTSIEPYALAQIQMLCDNPAFEGSKIRIMPDVHPGKVRTDHFPKLDSLIREQIPSGSQIRRTLHRYADHFHPEAFCCKNSINEVKAVLSLGSLGGGNHFIELDQDENGCFYVIIHSGSRCLGKNIFDHYMKKGQKYLKKQGLHVPYELTWLEGGLKEQYLNDLELTQQFAALNREAILDELLRGMKWKADTVISCQHNYVDQTQNPPILRKGAISAQKDEPVIIPIHMKDGVILGKGLGNPDWNCSAPHGAGRIMKRVDVGKHWTLSDYKKEMKGIYSPSISRGTLDESPFAYRSLEEIRSAAADAVSIEKILRPVYNFKAGEEA